MFLTPEQEPFYGGTYFPPEDRYGRPGFPRILAAVTDAYHRRPGEVTKSIQQIRDGLKKLSAIEASPGELSPDILTNAARALANNLDMVHGGFGNMRTTSTSSPYIRPHPTRVSPGAPTWRSH